MFKKICIAFSIVTFSHANLFTITDREGNIFKSKALHPTHNASLKQKATEYSLQAIYDELHRAENLARMAQASRLRSQRIALAQKKAAKEGKTYQVSERDRQKLLAEAKLFQGGRYLWGGTTPEGFDCSGYVQYLYKKNNINLPRTAWAQSQQGVDVPLEALEKGDLLFFLTDKTRGIPVTHVGIYIGNGEFIHAASKEKGIIISPLTRGSYAKSFVSAKRVVGKS
ncbi:MAG: C40 family peptidase [Campylobacterota bacterium]|nr:C40 family peptidase [Campylobacterota bacterium]